MKKRILSFVLVFALVCSMSIGASAASVSKTGKTSGGQIEGLVTSATLEVYTDHAVANTGCEADSGFTIITAVRFYYMDANNAEKSVSNSGRTTASAYKPAFPATPNGIRGESDHYVYTNAVWGNWGCHLGANVW